MDPNIWVESELRRTAEQGPTQPDDQIERWTLYVPVRIEHPTGPTVAARIRLDPSALGRTDEDGLCALLPPIVLESLIEQEQVESSCAWLAGAELLLIRVKPESREIWIVQTASRDLRAEYRIPNWIQNPDPPTCCGRLMYFVGQIDDDELCSQRPHDALMWWHDSASFYVFTCAVCMGVRAVGQQY